MQFKATADIKRGCEKERTYLNGRIKDIDRKETEF